MGNFKSEVVVTFFFLLSRFSLIDAKKLSSLFSGPQVARKEEGGEHLLELSQ